MCFVKSKYFKVGKLLLGEGVDGHDHVEQHGEADDDDEVGAEEAALQPRLLEAGQLLGVPPHLLLAPVLGRGLAHAEHPVEEPGGGPGLGPRQPGLGPGLELHSLLGVGRQLLVLAGPLVPPRPEGGADQLQQNGYYIAIAIIVALLELERKVYMKVRSHGEGPY